MGAAALPPEARLGLVVAETTCLGLAAEHDRVWNESCALAGMMVQGDDEAKFAAVTGGAVQFDVAA